jgi:transposase
MSHRRRPRRRADHHRRDRHRHGPLPPGHLVSWARFAPGVKESAGKTKGKATTGRGNPYLARALGEAAVAAGKTSTFLGERYRRIARRRGAKRAVGRSAAPS